MITILFSKFYTNEEQCFRFDNSSINHVKSLFIHNVIQKKSNFKQSHLIINRTKR